MRLTTIGRNELGTANVRRDAGLDALRASLTLLVLFHHTAITYGGSGDWYYKAVPAGPQLSSQLLSLFTGFNQAFFMGLFFSARRLFHAGRSGATRRAPPICGSARCGSACR